MFLCHYIVKSMCIFYSSHMVFYIFQAGGSNVWNMIRILTLCKWPYSFKCKDHAQATIITSQEVDEAALNVHMSPWGHKPNYGVSLLYTGWVENTNFIQLVPNSMMSTGFRSCRLFPSIDSVSTNWNLLEQ